MPIPSHALTLPGNLGHVYSIADGSFVLRTAAGQFLTIDDPPPGLIAALRAPALGIATEIAAESAPEITTETDFAQRLISEARARHDTAAEARWPASRRGVIVVGEGLIVDAVAQALRDWGCELTLFPTADALDDDPAFRDASDNAHDTLLISYADSAVERRAWSTRGQGFTDRLAWLRAYREGEVCFVDPLTVGAHDADAHQVLRRRVAASLSPTALTRWGEIGPRSPVPDTYSRAMVVSRILTVALAWAQQRDDVDVFRRTLWKLVPLTGRATEHPVLGYPQPYGPTRGTV